MGQARLDSNIGYAEAGLSLPCSAFHVVAVMLGRDRIRCLRGRDETEMGGVRAEPWLSSS